MSPTQPTGLTEAEDRLADQLEYDDGVTRLARLGAIDDMQETMAQERRSSKRDTDAAHRALWGGSSGDEDAAGDEDMKVMAGGNVTVNYTTQKKASEEPPKTPAKTVASSPLSSLAKIGIGAGLLATGAGIPFAVPAIVSGIGGLFNGPAAVAPSDQKPEEPPITFGIKVGKP